MARYTDRQKRWLANNIGKATYAETAEKFNAVFNQARSGEQIGDFARRSGLGTMYSDRGAIRWNAEKDEYMRSIIPGHSQYEISDLFYERYGVRLTKQQINGRKRKLGVTSGTHNGRFKKGQAPHNKGKTWEELGYSEEAKSRMLATCFKKGNTPGNTLPIGSTFKDRDGIVYVKVKESGKRFGKDGSWRPRGRIVWEKHNGQLSDDEIIVHANKVPDDDRIENLAKVDKSVYHTLITKFSNYSDQETLALCVDLARLSRIKAKKQRQAKEAGHGSKLAQKLSNVNG